MLEWLRQVAADYAFSRFMTRKGAVIRDFHMVQRKRDGTLWAGGHAQSIAYSMRGLFSRKPQDRYHFWKVRTFRGCNVVSRKVFWQPKEEGEFALLLRGVPSTAFELRPFSEEVECRLIDAYRGDGAPPKPDPVELGKRITIKPRVTYHEPDG